MFTRRWLLPRCKLGGLFYGVVQNRRCRRLRHHGHHALTLDSTKIQGGPSGCGQAFGDIGKKGSTLVSGVYAVEALLIWCQQTVPRTDGPPCSPIQRGADRDIYDWDRLKIAENLVLSCFYAFFVAKKEQMASDLPTSNTVVVVFVNMLPPPPLSPLFRGWDEKFTPCRVSWEMRASAERIAKNEPAHSIQHIPRELFFDSRLQSHIFIH